MPVLPHQDRTTVSPRGLSDSAENATSTFLMRSILYYITSCSQIYKSTKCNDMQQCGSCPRGPFCAFAHVESKFPLIFVCTRPRTHSLRSFRGRHFLDFLLSASRILCSRRTLFPHTELPTSPSASGSTFSPGGVEPQQTPHGARVCLRLGFRSLLAQRRGVCSGAGAAGKRLVSV